LGTFYCTRCNKSSSRPQCPYCNESDCVEQIAENPSQTASESSEEKPVGRDPSSKAPFQESMDQESSRPFNLSGSATIPACYDFDNVSSLQKGRIEVEVTLPIGVPAGKEIQCRIRWRSSVGKETVAVWLQRDGVVSAEANSFQLPSESILRTICLPDSLTSYQLCIRPKTAENWYWRVTLPVLVPSTLQTLPNQYVFDNSTTAAEGGIALGGYMNIRIESDRTAVSATLGAILDIVPSKQRLGNHDPVYCARRNRQVYELSILDLESRFYLYGGTSLIFGRDKAKSDRDNRNDICFRPSKEMSRKLSRSHGELRLGNKEVVFKHIEEGKNERKSTQVRANGHVRIVEQPELLRLPTSITFELQPILAQPFSKGCWLRARCWKRNIANWACYAHRLEQAADGLMFPELQSITEIGAMSIDIVDEQEQIAERHWLVSSDVVLGSHPVLAQIVINGPGVRERHARILFVAGVLWIEPFNSNCRVRVDGHELHAHQMTPLTQSSEICLGEHTLHGGPMGTIYDQ
jgi:hypothetical protein